MRGRYRRKRLWIVRLDAIVVTVCLLLVMGAATLSPSIVSQSAVWNDMQSIPAWSALAANPSVVPLRDTLVAIAKQWDRAPVDARVDRFERLIPALNGRQLDIEATLARSSGMVSGDPGQIPLVFRQISPRVTGKDFVAEPIYRGNPGKRQIALMFNVAWGTEFVPQIISILKTYHVTSTFFLDGSWTAANANVAKSIVEAGMEVGNHAYNHPAMSKLSRVQMIEQISKTNRAIEQATGVSARLFAPPSGDFNAMTVRVAAGLHMQTVLWTLDTIDWRRPPAAKILSRILPRATAGALVLMHPTAPTVAALPAMIVQLQKDGYQLVTVSSLLSPEIPVPVTLSDAKVLRP